MSNSFNFPLTITLESDHGVVVDKIILQALDAADISVLNELLWAESDSYGDIRLIPQQLEQYTIYE